MNEAKVDKFQNLLIGFSAAAARSSKSESAETNAQLLKYRALLAGFRQAVIAWQKAQETTADDFNILDVMQVTGRETMHSGVLAWLLASDITGLGSHAQGSLGFQLFLEEMRLPGEYAQKPYWVKTEHRGGESIIDIEIASRGNFIIHIENKIWSEEGHEQTGREWRDLKKRAEYLDVRAGSIHAIFLTPSGFDPSDHHFVAVPWSRIVHLFDRFSEQSGPPEVRMFCRHYAKVIRRSILEIEDSTEVANGEFEVQ